MLEQLSSKKQIMIGLSMLAIILVGAEIFSNFWWYELFECKFEKNELDADIDEETARTLCLENIGLEIMEARILPNQAGLTININSEGFRGPEITQVKPDDTYRIMLVGGSVVYGLRVLDNQTISYYLQEEFNQADFDLKVEVINSGIPGIGSKDEIKLIKERLIKFEPDLIIVSDSANEMVISWRADSQPDELLWKERWKEICQLGQKNNFETIITLQPFIGAGNKILTEKEQNYFQESDFPLQMFVELYPRYSSQLEDLKEDCNKTADLTGIFDSEYETVYYDEFHTNPKGNQFFSKVFYSLALPNILEKQELSDALEDEPYVFSDNFQGEILVNYFEFIDDASITINKIAFNYKTPKALLHLKKVVGDEFFEKLLIGGNSDLKKDELGESSIQKEINLLNKDLRFLDFSNKDLSNLDLSGADLSWADFTNAQLVNVNLTGAKLVGTILVNSNLENASLTSADLSVAILRGANLRDSDLSYADLSGANLEDANLSNAIAIDATLHLANLKNTNLTNANLNGADLFGTELGGASFDGTKLLQTKLACFNHPICN